MASPINNGNAICAQYDSEGEQIWNPRNDLAGGNVVTAQTNPLTGRIGISVAGKPTDPSILGAAGADGVFTKYGATAFDIAAAPGVGNTMVIGVTDLTHAVSNERPRFSTYTRKCTLGATGTSEIRFVQMNAFDPDPVEKAFSIDVYLESHPTEFNGTGLNPNIDIQISNSSTTNIGSNYSRWSWGATGLRQGWNTLKFRQADTVDSVNSSGNLPTGVLHQADVGTGFDWVAGGARCVYLRFTNMANQIVHIDQIRRPAKAKSVLVIGFDSNGSGYADDIFTRKVAPLFAQYGIRSYCTYTNIYEMLYAGAASWKRMASLYNDYGWDIINHTWSHGATAVGRNVTLASLVAVSDVCTATFVSAHGIALGTKFKARIKGASISAANGVFEMLAATTTTATYTATGAGSATATGTILLTTFLSEVLDTNNAENIRLTRHEVADVSRTMRACGFSRAAGFLAYPNNMVPELSLMQDAAQQGGVVLGRGARHGYTNVNEFGIDNPLNFGSYEITSGATGTLTSTIQAKIAGAISRGDHIQIFGHYIVDETDPANAAYAPVTSGNEYPPAMNGNPNPPSGALSGTGGWWYLGQLNRLLTETIGPAIASGDLIVMSPSEYARYMGYV